MLLSVSLPGAEPLALRPGLAMLRNERALVPAVVGWGLFDSRSHALPASGRVEVELVPALDGRRYGVRRALDVPEHWQVVDCETGWLAASGSFDVQEWVRRNLAIPEDLPLAKVFHDFASFSVPVTIAWLLEAGGVRERKLADLLRTEHYRGGVRRLDSALGYAREEAYKVEAQLRAIEGRDGLFDHFRACFDLTREGSIAAADKLTKLRQALAEAETNAEKLSGLQTELAELQRELRGRALSLASLEAQAERWRHWATVRERAEASMAERRADWQAYQDAASEIAKLAVVVVDLEPRRTAMHALAADVLSLQREQALLEIQMESIRAAETAAADLGEAVQKQQHVEQQIGVTQERLIRLELAKRSVQQTLAETKRLELLLGDVERQLADLEQSGSQASRVKKLEGELEEQRRLAGEAAKQVDHLHFLEAATRSISSHLDELRKGASATERLAVTAVAGNGSARDEDRSLAGHLRAAIDQQVGSLERQLRDWQTQSRELAGAPMRLNQLRSTIHQLEQELASTRQLELKLGGLPALKHHRKSLREQFDRLKKLSEQQLKEQHEHADAPAQLGQLRRDLSAMKDPRAERQAQLRIASRKQALESELRQVQRRLGDAEQRQTAAQQHVASLEETQRDLAAQERRRDQAHEGYCTYLAQRAIAELAEATEPDKSTTLAELAAQRNLQEEGQTRESGLLAAIAPLEDAAVRSAVLRAQAVEAELLANDWQQRYQTAADEFAGAEQDRVELGKRRAELDRHSRAQASLREARASIEEAERLLGQRIRQDMADRASMYARLLLDDAADVSFTWTWGEAPALVRAGASRALAELSQPIQAYCALALRLALAAEASQFGTVFVDGLGHLQQSEEFVERLNRLPGVDQFLVASA